MKVAQWNEMRIEIWFSIYYDNYNTCIYYMFQLVVQLDNHASFIYIGIELFMLRILLFLAKLISQGISFARYYRTPAKISYRHVYPFTQFSCSRL